MSIFLGLVFFLSPFIAYINWINWKRCWVIFASNTNRRRHVKWTAFFTPLLFGLGMCFSLKKIFFVFVFMFIKWWKFFDREQWRILCACALNAKEKDPKMERQKCDNIRLSIFSLTCQNINKMDMFSLHVSAPHNIQFPSKRKIRSKSHSFFSDEHHANWLSLQLLVLAAFKTRVCGEKETGRKLCCLSYFTA